MNAYRRQGNPGEWEHKGCGQAASRNTPRGWFRSPKTVLAAGYSLTRTNCHHPQSSDLTIMSRPARSNCHFPRASAVFGGKPSDSLRPDVLASSAMHEHVLRCPAMLTSMPTSLLLFIFSRSFRGQAPSVILVGSSDVPPR